MAATGFRGADTAQLRALASQFRSASERLTTMSATLARRLAQTQWYGSDADLFRADWSARWSVRIASVAAAIAEAGTALDGQADQQDAASVADWSVPAGRGGAGPSAGAASRPAGGPAAGTTPHPAGGPAAGRAAWNTWSDWYGRLSAARGLMPFVASAVAWPDAPRLGPKTWSDVAEGWSRVHLPTAALGRALGALDVAAVASDGVQAVTDARAGDAVGALEHGIPAAFGAMAAAPYPVVKLVGIAGSAGWTVGSWIQAPINDSSAGIWMGDHIVGPAGDAIAGAWHWLGRQVSSGSGAGR